MSSLYVKSNALTIFIHRMRISTKYVSSVMLRSKYLEIQNVMTVKDPETPKKSSVNWRKIRRRIELCMREIILRFEMNL
jgi:hypothetical protein